MRRRNFLQAMPWLATLSAGAARASTTDLVVACDTTLGPVLRAAGDRFTARAGVRIHVFPTEPGLLLPQLSHEVQNDVIVTGLAALQTAAQRGLLGPGARSAAWRNRLVLAGRHGAQLDDGALAVPDPTPATDLDGPAILARMNLRPHRLLGAIDTAGVRFMLDTGAAQTGLLFMTDLHADPALEPIHPVPDDAYAPIVYAAAVSRLARRPNPDAFVSFLGTEDAMALLRNNGLELQQ